MITRQELLFLFLENIGISFKDVSKDFLVRKSIQKVSYLMQSIFQVNLGYQFGLYIYGPYSPTLAGDAFEICENIAKYKDTPKRYVLNDEAKKAVEEFKKLMPFYKNKNGEIETCATIHFLYSETFRGLAEKKDETVKSYFQKMKPHLSQYYDACLDILKKTPSIG
jgi:uncharacterized protein YwgA